MLWKVKPLDVEMRVRAVVPEVVSVSEVVGGRRAGFGR